MNIAQTRKRENYAQQNVQNSTSFSWNIHPLPFNYFLFVLDKGASRTRSMSVEWQLNLSPSLLVLVVCNSHSLRRRSSVICWNCCREEHLSESFCPDDREDDSRCALQIDTRI